MFSWFRSFNLSSISDLDINKIFSEIQNGNLSVLEELDKAGVGYTLSNNGQAFDDKTESYSVTFEVNGAKYTAYHEGLTKEQEEAKKRQEAKGRARLESFLNSYENVKTKKEENNVTSTTAAYIPPELPTVAPESEKDVIPSETVSTTPETTAQVSSSPVTTASDDNTSVTSNTTGGARSTTATNNTGITVENIMEKYGYNRDFAQLILDYISDRASKNAITAGEIAKNASVMFENLDEIVNPKLDKNDTFNDRPSGSVSYSEYPIDGSMVRKWDFLKFMLQKVIGDEIYEVFDKLKYEPVDSDTFKYFLNSDLSKYYSEGRELQYSYGYIINEFSIRLKDELKGEGNQDYSNNYAADSRSYYFRFGSLSESMDKNGNGFIDELFQKLTEYFTPLRNDAKYILEHCEDNNGAKVNLYLDKVLGEIEEHAQQGYADELLVLKERKYITEAEPVLFLRTTGIHPVAHRIEARIDGDEHRPQDEPGGHQHKAMDGRSRCLGEGIHSGGLG